MYKGLGTRPEENFCRAEWSDDMSRGCCLLVLGFRIQTAQLGPLPEPDCRTKFQNKK